jgi:hypothetical protein
MFIDRSLLRRLHLKRDTSSRLDPRSAAPAGRGPEPMPRMRWPA